MTEDQRKEMAKRIADKAHELSTIMPDGMEAKVTRNRVVLRNRLAQEGTQLRTFPDAGAHVSFGCAPGKLRAT